MINKYPKVTFIFDRRKIATTKRMSSVEIRVSHEGKQKYISTGVMLYANQWKNGVITNTPYAVEISQALDRIMGKVRQVLLTMIEEDNIDIFAISTKIKKQDSKQKDFIGFCRQRTAVRKFGKASDTQERYERFLRLFIQYGGIKEFSDITEENIILYDNYLKNKKLKTYSKWNNYHRFLNSFIIDAINEGYISKNPYNSLNLEKGKTSCGIEKYLTPEEFRKLKTAQMPTISLEKVRDVFIFQTYTCFSYTDLKSFDARAVQEVKGTKVYLGNRVKTAKPFTIPILSPAWDLLMKYEGNLPIISNVKYNQNLKVVAQAAGIDKPLSSHWARHTGATLLLNEGVPMQIVSKICGHSSTRITEQVYAKLLDETVVKAVQEVRHNLE